MKVPIITLANGQKMPQLGLGLWQVGSQHELTIAYEAAIKAGYRLFDTAQIYHNELYLGNAIKESKVKREDLFITTKIAVNNFGYKKAHSSFNDSLKKLQVDYVDLLLLHFPISILRKKSWTALEEILASGRAKSIGVSNYTIRHLEEMKKYAKEMPVVNQVELHVFLQQPKLIEYCAKNKITIEAYSPLAHSKVMDNKSILEIASKHSKSYAQIMLRYLIELGLVVIPKSIHPERIEQNMDIFDFKLDKEDLSKLKKLDQDLRTCWNPTHIP
jgi:diketogulonate reductase-like aldo/keto reductase